LRQQLSIDRPDSLYTFNSQPFELEIVILCALPVTARVRHPHGRVGQAHGLSERVRQAHGLSVRVGQAHGLSKPPNHTLILEIQMTCDKLR